MKWLSRSESWTIDWRIMETPEREWRLGIGGWALETAVRNLHWHLDQTSYTQYRLRNMETNEVIPAELFV